MHDTDHASQPAGGSAGTSAGSAPSAYPAAAPTHPALAGAPPEEWPGLEWGDQGLQRLEKLRQLRELGVDPYPPRFQRTATAAEAIAAYEAWEAAHPEAAGTQQTSPLAFRLAGRVLARRILGKLAFAHIGDDAGRIQLYFDRQALTEPPGDFDAFKRLVDLGDHIGAEGHLLRTKTGEISLYVERWTMLSKALEPLPEKWHGLQDQEIRYRRRYLDLLSNEEVRRVFRLRSAIVSGMRRYLDGLGFLEVETPVLQPIYGGATARPFVTHHNQLDQDLYLRIADELYLKRLIVGGFEKVYEIGHDFRNEGVDFKHNTEFTMLECYQAYADYNTMMELVEGSVTTIAQETLGTLQITFRGAEIDLTRPWRRVTMRDALRETTGIDFATYYNDRDGLYERAQALVRQEQNGARAAQARALAAAIKPGISWAKLLDELVGNFVEPTLVQPTFLIDYPAAISPLAKRTAADPNIVERFEVFVNSMELGNAFSELNDPLDQYQRFAEGAAERAAGDEEAHVMDLDYVSALMVGLPPTGGLGLGIDRLTMLLADESSIRDVILFPHMRPRS
jgi:lysyl-tRNA synthetase class 2